MASPYPRVSDGIGMHSEASAERHRVFLEYREVFTGKSAIVRKKKAIRNVIEKHRMSHQQPVVNSEIDKDIPTLRVLLKAGAFQSEEQARNLFSRLTPKSIRDMRLATQKNSAGSVIANGERRSLRLKKRIKLDPEETSDDNDDISTRYIFLEASVDHSIDQSHGAFELAPPQFPFDNQHSILPSVQRLLEASCFRFAKRWLPSVLEQYGWECETAGELTRWLRILNTHIKHLHDIGAVIEERTSLGGLAPIIAQVRHVAVHREHLTLEKFVDLVHAAQGLVEILQDTKSVSMLQALHTSLVKHAREMEDNTKALRQDMESKLFQIQREKEEKENQVISDAAQKRASISVAAGKALVASANALLAAYRPDRVVGEQSLIRGNEDAVYTCSYTSVEEDDIESDEDLLQAELG